MAPQNVIKKIRLNQKLSIRKFSEKIQVDHAYLSRVEKGSVPPSDKLLKKVSKYFKQDIDRLRLATGKLPKDIYKIFHEHPSEAASVLRESFSVYNYEREIQEEKSLQPIYESSLGKLYKADCLDLLPKIDTESIDCIFADPPFNLNKNYGAKVNDNLAEEKYLQWSYQWLEECVRILKPGGSLFVYNIPKWNVYYSSFLIKQLTFRHWIAVNIKLSLPIPGRLYPSHYSLLYFTKGKPQTFNHLRVPIPKCRHCGGDIKDYGGHRKFLNPLGLNLTDVWDDIPPVRHKKNKARPANELSVKLLERVLKIATQENDLVFDPFGGGGTTYYAAERLKRRWIGCEIEDCFPIIRRIEQNKKENLLLI